VFFVRILFMLASICSLSHLEAKRCCSTKHVLATPVIQEEQTLSSVKEEKNCDHLHHVPVDKLAEEKNIQDVASTYSDQG
jgi:hypothetical protein